LPLTELQRDTIQVITTIFETGRLPGPQAYATTALLADGAGISYGRHQATARSSSLTAILREYEARGGTLLPGDYTTLGSSMLADCEYLDAAARARGCRKPASAEVRDLMQRLRRWGTSPAMMGAQDKVFDRLYFTPALDYAESIGLVLPLSYSIVFDTYVHSGRARIDILRRTFPEMPPSRDGDERAWSTALLRARHGWLSAHPTPVIRGTAYRTQALLGLVAAGHWMLERPLVVRGVAIL
jgi:chitosanase